MENSLIKFSICIVTYNAKQTLEDTLLSIINQKYLNKEIIIIDGKSSDDTHIIISKYIDNIQYYISETDDGIYDAMNKALMQASGNYLIFLGADDIFLSNDVLSMVATYIKDEKYIYYGSVIRKIRNDVYCKKYNKFKLAVKNICHQAIFYPYDVYKDYHYNLKYKIFADYAYNLNLYSKKHFEYIPILICLYNDSGSSATIRDLFFEHDSADMIIKNLGYLPYFYSVVYHFLRNFIKND